MSWGWWGSSPGWCDPGGGRPGAGGGRPLAGVTWVGVVPGLVARQPPQRPDWGLRAGCPWGRGLLPGLSSDGQDTGPGGCGVAGSWCSDSRGQHRATEGKGLTGRPARPRGRVAHEAGPGTELRRVPSALGEERVSLPLNVCTVRLLPAEHPFLGFWNLLQAQVPVTLCDPIDGSPPGSPVPGILQARTLEWVAISFSNA